MKTITIFYLSDCPFCKKAFAYIDELKKQEAYQAIELELIEEEEEAELANQFDYYYVPTFYIDGEKVHEGGILPEEVEEIFKKAVL